MSITTQSQINIVKKTLAKKDTKVCGGCFKNDNDSSETVEWIQCDSCLLWIYITCTIPKLNAIADNYICQFSNTEHNTK